MIFFAHLKVVAFIFSTVMKYVVFPFAKKDVSLCSQVMCVHAYCMSGCGLIVVTCYYCRTPLLYTGSYYLTYCNRHSHWLGILVYFRVLVFMEPKYDYSPFKIHFIDFKHKMHFINVIRGISYISIKLHISHEAQIYTGAHSLTYWYFYVHCLGDSTAEFLGNIFGWNNNSVYWIWSECHYSLAKWLQRRAE